MYFSNQEIFTEKVLTQSDQISDLHKVAVETVENTRGGKKPLILEEVRSP